MENEKTGTGRRIIQEAIVRRELKDDYRKVFLGNKISVKVLTDLLQFCGVLRPIYDPGRTLEETAFEAGRQSVGLLLMDVLDRRGYEAIIELEKTGAKLTEIGEDDENF